MCGACGAALPGQSKPATSGHARFVTHEIKPIPWVAHKRGTSMSNPAPLGSQQTPHGCMAWASVTALVIGLITFFGWHDDAYCQRYPRAGPDMLVDRPCYEVLAESSGWRVVAGEVGGWLILGSVVGFVLALWWFFRLHLRKRSASR